MASGKGKVCVTGAGSYVGSWLIKLLLSKDYVVHGTARDPSDEKNCHLYKFEKASENLKMFKADLLDYNSIHSAMVGCSGVFHVASPLLFIGVTNPEMELLEPAVKGTQNVLKACLVEKVKRVVIVSSGAAVYMNPRWPKNQLMDETCWSDKEYCRTTKSWYHLSKTEAESEAVEFSKKTGLDVVTVCPMQVFGPLPSSKLNASNGTLLRLLKEGYESLKNTLRRIVDVRDVAEALVLVYEKPEAKGRYICMADMVKEQDIADKLKPIYPNYNYPKTFTEVEEEEEKLSSEKLQKLGWSYRPLMETLIDSVESFKKFGIIN